MQRIQAAAVEHLLLLQANQAAAIDVRTQAWSLLAAIGKRAAAQLEEIIDRPDEQLWEAHYQWLGKRILMSATNPTSDIPMGVLNPPPGSPI
jgi:predicted component of type VI protein secretion system